MQEQPDLLGQVCCIHSKRDCSPTAFLVMWTPCSACTLSAK